MADHRITELTYLLRTGNLSRRHFVQRATAMGLGLAAITSILADDAGAAPVATRRNKASLQADASTLVVADITGAAGGKWLTMDPAWFYEIEPAACMYLLFDTLYHIPDSANTADVQPLLAEGMPEYSEDGLTATVRLKSGVTFAKTGNPMTAADWIFSWARLASIGFQGSFLATEYWTEAAAVDDTTIEFTLAAPSVTLATVLTSLPLAVTDSVRVKELGGTDQPPAENAEETTAADDETAAAISAETVGTGPYMMSQYDIEAEVILERNPNFWGEAGAFERIIWTNSADANTELQKVQLGDADIAVHLNADQVETVKSDANLQLLTGPTLAIEYIGMNVTEEKGGPLANLQVRQAIAHAVDYDAFITDILSGAADRPASPVPFGLLGADKVREKAYVLDLTKAQELWDASGVGEQEVDLIYTSDGSAAGGVTYETLAVKVQSDLQQIQGLTVKLTPLIGTERIARYRAGDFQMTISPWTPDYPDVHSFAEPFARTATAAAGRVGYSDPAVDALLDQGIVEADLAAREAIYVQIQEAIIEAAAFLVLYQPLDQRPASVDVAGATTHSVYQLSLRGASKSA